MAGGNMGGAAGGGGQSQITQALQNYPAVPTSGGAAQSFGAGTAPTASSVSNLQQLLQRFNAPGGGGGMSPAMRTANMGMNLAQMGGQQPQMGAPQSRPVMAPQPYQGPQVGNSQGLAIGGGGQGLPPGGLAQLLMMQQRGGGFF